MLFTAYKLIGKRCVKVAEIDATGIMDAKRRLPKGYVYPSNLIPGQDWFFLAKSSFKRVKVLGQDPPMFIQRAGKLTPHKKEARRFLSYKLAARYADLYLRGKPYVVIGRKAKGVIYPH